MYCYSGLWYRGVAGFGKGEGVSRWVVLNFDLFDLGDLFDYFITMPVLDTLKGMVFTD